MTPRFSATIGSEPRRSRSAREERGARALHPAADHRGRLVSRHLPVRLEAAEVVEAHAVDEHQRHAKALDPPGEAGARHRIPAVERVAPALAGGAEVVGRHPGDECRRAVLGEEEQLRMAPDVGAVVGHEDRHVAHEGDAAAMGVLAQREPLAEERVLHEAVERDLVGVRGALRLERRRLAHHDGLVPRSPRSAAVRFLLRHEQREVVEPRFVRAAKGGELGARPGRGVALERRERLAKQRELPGLDGGVIDVAVAEAGSTGLQAPCGAAVLRPRARRARAAAGCRRTPKSSGRASRRSRSVRAAAPATRIGPRP